MPSQSRNNLSQETRAQLFRDYVETGQDTMEVEGRFFARLEESTKSTCRYGFRNDTWLVKHHGQKKADRIMQRKADMGLTLGR